MASPLPHPPGVSGSEESGVHLIVVSHGMWGNPFHTAYLVSQLENALPEQTTQVKNVNCNSGIRSYSGVATGGRRIAQVVEEAYERNPINSLSFIGYSAGGLWVQYAAMLLDQGGFFQKVQPRLFVAVASPLIGVYSPPEHRSHFWFYRSVFNCVGMNLAGCIGGRTVEELLLSDDDEQPLLLQMASPNNPYGQALKKFYRRVTFGNTRNDFLVPFESSGLAQSNPFPEALEEEGGGSLALSEERRRRLVLPLAKPVRPENAWSTQEKLTLPPKKLGWCRGFCEFFQAIGTTVVLLSIWLPIIYTLTISFVVPLVFSLFARRYYNKESSRRKSDGGRVAMCPCHCLRGKRRVANRVWHEALQGRLAQGFECMPVRFQWGNAHAKIINRPFCCFSNCYADGRISVKEIVTLFVDLEKHSSAISTSGITIQ